MSKFERLKQNIKLYFSNKKVNGSQEAAYKNGLNYVVEQLPKNAATDRLRKIMNDLK